ncbi:DUF488 domain-containing protein [Stutzerimonas stutzeri]|uniref:DUF488 domain-containing protein n=1 Tax=Stutzerimonas stutzeri TaxID=316 RepID=A0A2S4ANK8_STUST|nr:DUF488 family protein [Stutzerimonas stutzeri]MCQ4265032.1 DUF488 family protein [Stutzerimonas stutzeri]POH82954.1 DUF488 domain-containing protein [Stutzerimonas stutzeri]
MIQCKRAYLVAATSDGRRVLVDRLWPRGCSKDGLVLHAWLPSLAPSAELRKAFKRGELMFEEFAWRYRSELASHPEHWWPLLEMAEQGALTLIYAAREEQQNNAQVLAEWLELQMERLNRPSSSACFANELEGGLNDDG